MSLIKVIKISSLALIGTISLFTFPKEVKAQWISIGRNINGDVYYVSSTYWTLEQRPNIRVFYSRPPMSPTPKGILTAVNCGNGAYSFDVSGDGNYFYVSSNEYSWTFPAYDSMAASMVEMVCNY